MNKKGVSIMIGYVLLVSAAIVMSFIVYSWMKTYIPKEGLKCPDDVSIVIMDDVQCTQEGLMLVNIKNNGLFNVDGYTIKGDAWKGSVGIGKIDLYKGGYFYLPKTCKPQEQTGLMAFGNITAPSVTIKEIEITPIRAQINEETEKSETTICGDSIVKKNIEDLNCVIKINN